MVTARRSREGAGEGIIATVTLTQRFGNLDDWVGNLFAAGDGTGTVVASRSATSMVVTLGDATPFPGYQILVTGTGFRFKDGIAIAGTMTQVQVVN